MNLKMKTTPKNEDDPKDEDDLQNRNGYKKQTS